MSYVMIILEIIVYVVIPPFHRFIDANMMQDYMYPSKKESVPTWSILLIAILIPLLIFFLYFLKRSVRDFHNAFLGLATPITLTALFTDSIKNCVSMPRPDFFHRCFPDGIASYAADGQALCHPISTKTYHDEFSQWSCLMVFYWPWIFGPGECQAGYPYEYQPQGIFSHGLHGPRAVPSLNGPPNDVEAGRI